MRFTLTRDAERFAALVQPFLSERIERNVLATVLVNVLDGRHADLAPLFAYATGADRRVVWAALRTPPWRMVATELDPSAAPELVRQWYDEDPHLPGVNAPPGTARAIAAQWTALTDRAATLRTSMAMHELGEPTDPPRPAPGGLRPATRAERPLLVEWWRGFALDAGVAHGGGVSDFTGLDSRLEHGGLLIWEHDGPASLVGVTRPVAGVVRIGPVYTPPALRGRGYAGTAVAAASRRVLDDGARACILFTDLANPTSNKIYAEVGYRRRSDWEEHEFARPLSRDGRRAERRPRDGGLSCPGVV